MVLHCFLQLQAVSLRSSGGAIGSFVMIGVNFPAEFYFRKPKLVSQKVGKIPQISRKSATSREGVCTTPAPCNTLYHTVQLCYSVNSENPVNFTGETIVYPRIYWL